MRRDYYYYYYHYYYCYYYYYYCYYYYYYYYYYLRRRCRMSDCLNLHAAAKARGLFAKPSPTSSRAVEQ